MNAYGKNVFADARSLLNTTVMYTGPSMPFLTKLIGMGVYLSKFST
jgi:hypothetical protein